MRTIIEVLEAMERSENASLGIWAGGVAVSLYAIKEALEREGHKGFVAYAETLTPSEGRGVFIACEWTPFTILEQHWHGGPNSGAWWWTIVPHQDMPKLPDSFYQILS
jgi:hypothetical protein